MIFLLPVPRHRAIVDGMSNAKAVKIVSALAMVGGIIAAGAGAEAGMWALLAGFLGFVVGRFME